MFSVAVTHRIHCLTMTVASPSHDDTNYQTVITFIRTIEKDEVGAGSIELLSSKNVHVFHTEVEC